MKKFLLLMAIIAIGITSCTKENLEQEHAITEEPEIEIVELLTNEITEEIVEITQYFIKSQPKMDSRISVEAGLRAIDVGAGLDSYLNGNDMVTVLNDAYSASAEAYAKVTGGITPPNPTGDVSLSDNPYDFVGKYHVELLDYVIKEPNNVFISGNNLNFSACLNYANSVLNSANLPSYSGTAASLEQAVNSAINKVESANHLVSSLVTGQSNADIVLKNYFLAMESTQEVQEFIDYSVQVELMIIGNSGFNSQEKAYLLSNMATARHDSHYWGS